MAALAIDRSRSQIFIFSLCFQVAVDTGNMRCISHGNSVVLGFLLMAISAGSLTALGIKQHLRFFIIFMMTLLTFIFMGFYMTIMKGFIHSHRLTGRNHLGLFTMAISANQWPGFFTFGGNIRMTLDTVVMVNAHYFISVTILKAHVFDR